MSLTIAPCAVCGSTAFRVRFRGTIPDPRDHPAKYYSSSRELAGYLDVVQCVRCGLLMTNPRDDDVTIAEAYSGLRDTAYEGEERGRLRTAREFLQLVESHHPTKGGLLDVGCATGVFAAVAHQSGWSVTGVEASGWAIERARRRCPGATFVRQLLEDVDFRAASFDVVTLWDVLEHVRSPAATLARIRRWLAPGGRLFLNLPDAGSWTARSMGRHWVLLLREHLWYFDSTTLAQLLRKCEFELIETRPNSVNFSLQNVFGRAAQYQGIVGRVARSVAGLSLLKHLHLRFRMGEMQVVARPVPPNHTLRRSDFG